MSAPPSVDVSGAEFRSALALVTAVRYGAPLSIGDLLGPDVTAEGLCWGVVAICSGLLGVLPPEAAEDVLRRVGQIGAGIR